MEIGFLYAIGAAITWGLVYSIDEKILGNVTPIAFIFISSIITPILILPFVLRSGLKATLSSGVENFPIIILSVVLGLFANFFILSGIKNLNASTASIIEISYPFFVLLFSFIIFRTTPNLYFFLGGILVFIGSVIIIKFA